LRSEFSVPTFMATLTCII